MGSIITKNFRKFDQDYRFRDALKKIEHFLNLSEI